MLLSEVHLFIAVLSFRPRKPNGTITCPFAFALGETCAKTNSIPYLYRTKRLEVKGNLSSIDAKSPFKDVKSYRRRSPNIQGVSPKRNNHFS